MAQPFSIVRRVRAGVVFYQVTDHRNHVDYRVNTKREATALAKRIEAPTARPFSIEHEGYGPRA